MPELENNESRFVPRRDAQQHFKAETPEKIVATTAEWLEFMELAVQKERIAASAQLAAAISNHSMAAEQMLVDVRDEVSVKLSDAVNEGKRSLANEIITTIESNLANYNERLLPGLQQALVILRGYTK